MIARMLLLLSCALALAACASRPPFEAPVEPSPPVWQVAEDTPAWRDREVLWGGMIVGLVNRERYTEIEVLAYPLDLRQRPRPDQPDEGRFLVIVPGYLDATDYPAGRFVTVPGRISSQRDAFLRGQPYVWPMLDTRQLMLWPRDFRTSGARFSIGVGVRL